jgi:hypothetical protein
MDHVLGVRVVERFSHELTVHTYIEEKIFYPEARKAVPAAEDHVLESIEEHHVVVWTLSELSGLDPKYERYDAKVTVLIENVRHHVEEEQEWFPQVRKAMKAATLEDLGAAARGGESTASRERPARVGFDSRAFVDTACGEVRPGVRHEAVHAEHAEQADADPQQQPRAEGHADAAEHERCDHRQGDRPRAPRPAVAGRVLPRLSAADLRGVGERLPVLVGRAPFFLRLIAARCTGGFARHSHALTATRSRPAYSSSAVSASRKQRDAG